MSSPIRTCPTTMNGCGYSEHDKNFIHQGERVWCPYCQKENPLLVTPGNINNLTDETNRSEVEQLLDCAPASAVIYALSPKRSRFICEAIAA